MSPAEAAIREALPKLEEWVAQGCPVSDAHDVYPDDIYAAVTRPAEMRTLLSELDALRASEYRELIEELDDLSRYRNGQHPDQRKAAYELERLTRELEEARKDQARYRWLRDDIDSDWAICEWSADDYDGCGFYRDARAPHLVDAAIDAAMSQEK